MPTALLLYYTQNLNQQKMKIKMFKYFLRTYSVKEFCTTN